MQLDGIGEVTAYKRRGTRSLRLRIVHDGTVRVTLPYWIPYRAAKDFVQSKRDWINEHRPARFVISHDDIIGKTHQVKFRYVQRKDIRIRVNESIIQVSLPFGIDKNDPVLQRKLHAAGERALRKQAQAHLPRRLAELAAAHGFTYGKVSIKKMNSRWGSCSSQSNISLNVYLMQLSDELIDYVLLHELTHTRVLAHGRPFWNELAHYVENLADIRRTMRHQEPSIGLRVHTTKD